MAPIIPMAAATGIKQINAAESCPGHLNATISCR